MKMYWKIFICILIIGVILCIAGFAMSGFQWSNLNSGGKYEAKSFTTNEKVNNITVDVKNAAVVLLKAENSEEFAVEYKENKSFRYDVQYSDGSFSIIAIKAKWYRNFFNLGIATPRIEIYLNEDAFENISLVTQNGSVSTEVPLSAGSFRAETDNGKITVKNLSVVGDAVFKSDNGKVSVEKVVCGGKLSAETDNGAVSASNASASEIYLETDNGAVDVYSLNAETITLLSDNGSIKGSISGRQEDFLIAAKTNLGHCNLRNTSTGSKKLTVKTDCGSIDISFLV